MIPPMSSQITHPSVRNNRTPSYKQAKTSLKIIRNNNQASMSRDQLPQSLCLSSVPVVGTGDDSLLCDPDVMKILGNKKYFPGPALLGNQIELLKSELIDFKTHEEYHNSCTKENPAMHHFVKGFFRGTGIEVFGVNGVVMTLKSAWADKSKPNYLGELPDFMQDKHKFFPGGLGRAIRNPTETVIDKTNNVKQRKTAKDPMYQPVIYLLAKTIHLLIMKQLEVINGPSRKLPAQSSRKRKREAEVPCASSAEKLRHRSALGEDAELLHSHCHPSGNGPMPARSVDQTESTSDGSTSIADYSSNHDDSASDDSIFFDFADTLSAFDLDDGE